jgi:hypothetical protein
MTVPPIVTTWPTLADERLMLMIEPSSDLANQRTVRALVHRIRELEIEVGLLRFPEVPADAYNDERPEDRTPPSVQHTNP